MKKYFTYLLAIAAVATVISCSKDDGPEEPEQQKPSGQDFTETVSGVKFDMVYVKGGTFSMGATEEQWTEDPDDEEYPVHTVTLSDYYIGKFEVTQGLWKAVMGDDNNPSEFKKGNEYPVDVSWNDMQDFLTELNKLTGKKYALPTEAQWEYAARGGAKSKGYKYSGSNTIDDVAWYKDNSDKETHPVGKKQANELGLYDMSGNVCEWCSSSWIRGGSCNDLAWNCRVSCRYFNIPLYRPDSYGFRVALLP